MGRMDSCSVTRRWKPGTFAAHYIAASSRYRFYDQNKILPIRLFPDMVKALTANNKNGKDEKSSLSSLQTLIVSTATRVGMGNLTGVVAAISAGGAGAVFWMWITALLDHRQLYRSNSCTVT